jgi:hypothetical protein
MWTLACGQIVLDACVQIFRRARHASSTLDPTATMRSLIPLVITANVLSALAVPTTQQVTNDNNRFFDSAKALLAQVDSLTGNVGVGVLEAVEAAVERVWKGKSGQEPRAKASFVKTNGVRCEYG